MALVFNPTVCSRFLRSSGPIKVIEAREDRLGGVLRNYLRLLRLTMRHPLLTFASALTLLALIIVTYGIFGHGLEFFPDTEPNEIVVDINAPSGTRLEISDSLVTQVEQAVTELPDLENYVASVGHQGSNMGFSFGGGATHESRVTVDFLDREDRSQNTFLTRDQLRLMLAGLTGADIEVQEQEHGPPTGPPINIEISGDNFALLGSLANEIRRIISRVEGVVDIRDDYDTGWPELRITVDREKAALLGVNTRDIAFTIRTAINGTEAAKYRVGEDEYDITVRFAKSQRSSIEDLEKIMDCPCFGRSSVLLAQGRDTYKILIDNGLTESTACMAVGLLEKGTARRLSLDHID